MFYLFYYKVEEASKFGIKVSRQQINQQFGQAYKQQLLKKPFYGKSGGMTPILWWKEVNKRKASACIAYLELCL